MKEVYVIAYYGSVYTNVYGHHGWGEQYIGEGIVHESKPFTSYPNPADRYIKENESTEKKYNYAKIEKRFYPEN